MIDIRKAWWGSALLVAFAGCSNEEPAGEIPPPPAASVPGAAGSPTMPPPTPTEKTDEAKAKDATTLPPAPAPTEKTGDTKKDDKLELEAPKAKDAGTEKKADEKKADEKKADEKKAEDKKADASSEKPTLSSEEVAEIEKLPAGEKELALAQILCPVSGEHLGSMGKPLKITAEGKTFLLCCKGCTKDVKDNPKEVVAKLNKK